ncbi:MAG: HAMP domain-containing histidine kinase [Oscillospiraceae bacterium]|nr:HAMP domain-containing histidine kinase [Oscillospiraceae bacterium]
MKFRTKMTLCMLALLSALFGIGGSLLIAESFRDALERERDAAFTSCRMAWTALQIVNGLDPYLDGEALSKTMEQLYEQDRSGWAALRLSTEETVLYSVENSAAYLLSGTPRPASGGCIFHIAPGADGEQYLLLSSAVETNGDILYLQTAHNISALYTTRRGQQQTYFRVFAIMAVLCAALSYTVSRVLTKPLEGLSQTSRAIAGGDFSSRVPVRSADEIGMVSEDFNAMAAQMEETVSQLHQAVERQERFVGSFAHEMKTPMTSLIGYAELLRSGTLTPEEQIEAAGYIYSEGKRLENLSRKLLELLVLKQKGGLPFTEISPSDLIGELVERLRPLCVKRNISVASDCQRGVCLMEPDLIWSLLVNLTDNAQKAMDGGGHILFRSDMLPDGCRIQVMDDGPGIPTEALAHLTEAFYRVDKARSRKQGGFGL